MTVIYKYSIVYRPLRKLTRGVYGQYSFTNENITNEVKSECLESLFLKVP